MNRSRNREYLERAVNMCGRHVGGNEWELSWPTTKVAEHLGLSYRTMRHHLRSDMVVSLSPVRVCLGNEPVLTPSSATQARSVPGRDVVKEIVDVVERIVETVTGEPDDELLLLVAVRLVDAAVSWREVQHRVPTREREPSSRFLREQTDRQSLNDSEFCLTDSTQPRGYREGREPELRESPKHVESALVIDEATVRGAISALQKETDRLRIPLIDTDGIQRLRRFEPDLIIAACTHVLSRMRATNVRSPYGLLLKQLESGNLPAVADGGVPKRPVPEPSRETAAQNHESSTVSDREIEERFRREIEPGLPVTMNGKQRSIGYMRAMLTPTPGSRAS